jgi:hypothetical protein
MIWIEIDLLRGLHHHLIRVLNVVTSLELYWHFLLINTSLGGLKRRVLLRCRTWEPLKVLRCIAREADHAPTMALIK